MPRPEFWGAVQEHCPVIRGFTSQVTRLIFGLLGGRAFHGQWKPTCVKNVKTRYLG